MSRLVMAVTLASLWSASPLAAQESDAGAEADAETAETVSAEDVLAESETYVGPPLPPECAPDPLNNRIVICAPRDDAKFRVREGFDWRTVDMKGDTPRAPDVFGISNHGVAISVGSVPEPVLMIDLEAIPEAPPGSDADRVARGLAPRGYDDPRPVPEETSESTDD